MQTRISQFPAITPLDPNVALFNSRRVRSTRVGSVDLYAAIDLVGRLSDAEDRAALWDRLRDALSLQPVTALFADAAGGRHELEGLSRAQALRLAAALDSHAARRIQAWLADRALEAETLEAQHATDDQARLVYRRRGESRPWIEKRQGVKASRRELAGIWYRRGIIESDQYRQLTNALFQSTFGMGVAEYRALKRLGVGDNLRDHMSGVDLTMVALAETLAGQLVQRRDAMGFDEILAATEQAGRVAAEARAALETLFGDVRSPANHLVPRAAA